MVEVDARGFSCPEPVIMTMNALKGAGSGQVRVQVSNSVARDNICSLAKKQKRTATAERVGDDYVITIA